jgi:hypothetical protein
MATKNYGTYPKFYLVLNSLIDRSAEIALTSIPDERRVIVLTALKEINSSIPVPQNIKTIQDCTKIRPANFDDKSTFIPDDSGELFLSIFLSSFMRLTGMLYRYYIDPEKLKAEPYLVCNARTTFSMCDTVSHYDPDFTLDFSPYDETLTERNNIDPNAADVCALSIISPSNHVRSSNAKLAYSDAEFIIELYGYLGK